VKEFVDRRGGGVLFLGGKDSLSDGGWAKSVDADILPTVLPDRKNTYSFAGADVELTPAGQDSLVTRIEEDPAKNVERWKKLPYIRTFQDPGEPKLGAIVLANFVPHEGGGVKRPLLITMNYGRGRNGHLRDGRKLALADAAAAGGYVARDVLSTVAALGGERHAAAHHGSTPKSLLADESHVKLRAEVRDKTYLPASDAIVEAHITGEGVQQETVNMVPEPLEQGVYGADWTAPQAGSYIVEVVAKRGTEEIGRDTFTFRREDGIAENFHVEQNRQLLEKLSTETGGSYYNRPTLRSWARTLTIPRLASPCARRAICGICRRSPFVPRDSRGGMAASPSLGCHMKKTHSAGGGRGVLAGGHLFPDRRGPGW